MDYFNDINSSVTVPLSLISGSSAAVKFQNTSAISADRFVVSYFELSYPRQFDFGNQKFFKFSLPATASGYNLQITNFNYGSEAPLLLDLTTGQRIITDISTPGMVKVVLGPGTARDLVLVNAETSNINSVASLTSKTFKRFYDVANQGNYVIITNTALFNGTHGNNPIEDYKNYRSSAVGGGFNVQVIDIDELVDQFAFGIRKHPSSIKNFLRFARANFSTAPSYVFLIGKGVAYSEDRKHDNDPVAGQLNLVPSFGSPASDNMLSSDDGCHSYRSYSYRSFVGCESKRN